MAAGQPEDSGVGIQEMARDLALAVALLRGGHGFYQDVLSAFQRHGGPTADVASLVEALDAAVRGHAHHDMQAKRLVEKYSRG